MYFEKMASRDLRFRVFVGYEDECRINEHHFRGKGVSMAGNFSRWPSFRDFIRDQEVSGDFFAEMRDAWNMRDFSTFGVEIDLGMPIGWSETDDRKKYDALATEWFRPNKRSVGLKVRSERIDLLAPVTTVATIVCSLQRRESGPCVTIFSAYPGPDIGEVRQDVTKRERVVFFDRNHPGA
jgi:hypothetical protein